MKERDTSIDYLKCLAALLITNSHMDLLYGKFSAFATGGSIGNALFFFCSGFTLFMGQRARFDNWYKRRIQRIFPSVFAWVIISALCLDYNWTVKSIILMGGGWFVSCIMIYYVLLYFIKRYMSDWLRSVFVVACVIVCASYIMIDKPADYSIYRLTFFSWIHYFLFMLLGAIVGKKSKGAIVFNTKKDVSLCLLSVILFYAMLTAVDKWSIARQLQLITLLPLLGIIYYSYKLFSATFAKELINNKYCGCVIKFVGGLCLEIYLVQFSVIANATSCLFPVNVILALLMIVVAAYTVRCLGRILSQTFDSKGYNWRAIFGLFNS